MITASRRPALDESRAWRHLSLDLLDPAGSSAALAEVPGVTHLVYAAYLERSTMAESVEPNVSMLRNALDGLDAAGAQLDRVVLIGGGKSYGEHLGPYKTPAKESEPRMLGPIFYNDQEDLLAARAEDRGFAWTVLRPDVVIGPSLGSPMNLLTSIAAYAAICQQAGVPLRFPGSDLAWNALQQITDADLLAAAVEWALRTEAAGNEIFNVTNGDLFRWRHLWPEIAAAFEMEAGSPQPMNLEEQMADKGPEWDALTAAHDLRGVPYEQFASWSFADSIWNSRFDMVQSTVKIRQAGFSDCLDSHQSLIGQLRRLRELRYVP